MSFSIDISWLCVWPVRKQQQQQQRQQQQQQDQNRGRHIGHHSGASNVCI
jgi:hypothetical protein